MQSYELMDPGCDIHIHIPWAERVRIAAELEALRSDIESSFERIFANEKSRLEADSQGSFKE